MVREIERFDRNRSRFVLDAVRRELVRRRREALRESLRSPHRDSERVAESGFDEWARSLPEEEADLVDAGSGAPVRWVPGQGWVSDGE